jgi:3' terminal RNA ribose 2'-O-methyltransferase Hen1
MGEEKIKTLLLNAQKWLAEHPAREEITKSYLQRQSRLTHAALLQLTQQDNLDLYGEQQRYTQQEAALETPLSLQQQRFNAVVRVLKQRGAKRVIDFGCGQGNLLKILLKDRFFEQITGVDVSYHCLQIAKQRLDRLRLPRHRWNCLQLIHSPLTYDNKRFQGYDAAVVLEVIEQLESWQIKAFERVLFERAQPKLVILTTPNREHNIKFPAQRREWTREEFQIWANSVAERFGYKVEFQPAEVEVEQIGSPTQMGIFIR